MAKYSYIPLVVRNGKLVGVDGLRQDQQRALRYNNCIYIYHGTTSGKYYIGQTKQFLERHKQHFNGTEEKFNSAHFNSVIVLFSEYLDNGTALDDVESKFITYFNADRKDAKGQFVSFDSDVINRTAGNSVVAYRDREKVASEVILPYWEKVLHPLGWVRTPTLDELRTRALVKYSPIKTLTPEQSELIREIIANPQKNYVINGDAGTGKTVLLTHLVASVFQNDKAKRIGVIVQPNWERTGREIFKIFGMDSDNLKVMTSTKLFTEGGDFDLIVVDESHKLSRKGNKQRATFNEVYKNSKYKDCSSHLEAIQKFGAQIVLMYDVLQAIRPANVSREEFALLTGSYEKRFLKTQFRIQTPKGKNYTSDDYVNGIKYLLFKDTGLLDSPFTNFNAQFNREVFQDDSPDAYFGYVTGKPMRKLFDWIEDDRNYNSEHINRVLSGMFCCETADKWKISDGADSSITHFHEDGFDRRWNSKQENWINIGDDDAEDQIGSVFAVQGIDLNKVGVMVGPDIRVNGKGVLEAVPENHNNTNNKFTAKEMRDPSFRFEFTLFILNQYYILMTRGIDGIRLGFWENDGFRDYMKRVLEIK